MRRFLLTLLLCTVALPIAACREPASSAGQHDVAPTARGANPLLGDDSDCNLSTPLDPHVAGSPGHLIPSARNPNGDSELAELMRLFVDDVRNARVLVEAGQPAPKMFATHRKMRCAWLTKPEERNERFDTMAQSYLVAVKAFDAAPGKDTYNGVVGGCIACHSQSCGGPLDFLASMRWQ